MTEQITNLENALRRELQQYAEMVALLERQQQQIGARQADEVFQSIAPVKRQGLLIRQARQHREECRAQLAQSLQQAKGSSLAALISLLPAESQDVLSSLVRQNNDLLLRVRQRARQNHLRLSRSIELIQGLINSIFPSRVSRTYNGRGTMKFGRIAPRSFYEATG
jgi:flagellar biosynthesis/type III secretory pathway chaperone